MNRNYLFNCVNLINYPIIAHSKTMVVFLIQIP